LSDLQISHETWMHPIGKVHKGFYEALRAVWGHPLGSGKELLPARLLGRGERALWITGHSLGGAIAELCAAQAWFVSHTPVQGVYTFGQPRVGDETFARTVHEALGLRIFRLVNDSDIVPRVPFFGMGFRHYGCEVFFDDQKRQVDGQPSLENLASALRLAKLALNLEAVGEAARMVAEATLRSGFHGNIFEILHQMMRVREDAALGAARLLLEAGLEKITDHDMTKNYLALLGTSLVLDTPPEAAQPVQGQAAGAP
jgi:hypothetical protein